ncbi:MAG TPA: GAF domain-containing protein [Sphingomicrobium sp.]|nr:GAF domain-containing protein [Sphingomicrobium sp.]
MAGPRDRDVQLSDSPFTPAAPVPGDVQTQSAGFVLELSSDWLILRASENVHEFLGEYHVSLIGEPLANFFRAQPLHDLRNTVSRQSGRSGIARAYRVRLTDDPGCFDIAFQLSGGKILFEGVPSANEDFGSGYGAVGGLIDELVAEDREGLLEGAARRMRALTGFDRVAVSIGDDRAESSRGNFAPRKTDASLNFPPLVGDTRASPMSLFPRIPDDRAPERALLRSPSLQQLEDLRAQGVRSILSVPLFLDGQPAGWIECEDRNPREPSFELHAAAELFAQMLALRLEILRLRS